MYTKTVETSVLVMSMIIQNSQFDKSQRPFNFSLHRKKLQRLSTLVIGVSAKFLRWGILVDFQAKDLENSGSGVYSSVRT